MDDLHINQIDFKWVDDTNEPKLLRKALKLLKDDGSFFPDLEKYIEEKLLTVDKKFKKLQGALNEKISPEEIKKQNEDILNWENNIKKSDRVLSGQSNDQNEVTDIQRKKLAENEKIKGNELMRTKEFDEAIRFYTNSINYDPTEATSYCNRSLAYIKKKNFEKGLKDCNEAINLKKDYSKAYYRRATCLAGLKKFREAFEDLLFILKDSPTNEEILSELKGLKDKWKESLGNDDWKKIESKVEQDIQKAKINQYEFTKENTNQSSSSNSNSNVGENKSETVKQPTINTSTTTPITTPVTNTSNTVNNSGFKKMKIVEEEEEEVKPQPVVDEKITPHLKSVFDKFIKNGEEIKVEMNRLLTAEKYDKASQIARESLKNCQNFIKDFKVGSIYHLQLEKAISDLNSCLSIIASKTKEKELKEEKLKNAETQSQKLYYKTKILPEDVRNSASKIAEAQMNFDDFPRTSYGFEKAFNSMKKRSDVFFGYLNYIGSANFVNFYKSSELSYQVLIGILTTLKESLTSQNNIKVVLDYLSDIPKTKNFALIKKFLKKSDKEDLVSFFTVLKEKYSESVQNINLDKLYF